MDEERFELVTAAAVNVLYCAALAAMIFAAWPAGRMVALGFWRQQVYAWRHGRWLASRRPAPQWTELLAREDLPQEQT